ncbi:MAG: GNAT family N-acetyltransferase [Dysgonamonadaceae bacterium]|jgi:predicted acetyltransferase|nr:GNAT family N-acetyltransferase [Dysgonamonadaceae bacterium]
MISFGEDKYKSGLKEMWKLCFPMDTDTFIDFYFDEVYKNDETLIYFENGKTAAVFQMIPYTLKNGEEISQAGYISGAMTHPDFRRKGFMKELLFASFDIMRTRGFDYTFLVPQEAWLFDFYTKFGYKTILPPKNLTNPSDHRYESAGPKQSAGNQYYITYSRFLSEIPQVVLKTEKQFQQILHDFFDENGVLFANEQGIAFTFQEKNKIGIKEFFYQNQKVKDLFLKAICDYYSQEEIVILNSPDHLTGLRGMIKRLNDRKPDISELYINMMLE